MQPLSAEGCDESIAIIHMEDVVLALSLEVLGRQGDVREASWGLDNPAAWEGLG